MKGKFLLTLRMTWKHIKITHFQKGKLKNTSQPFQCDGLFCVWLMRKFEKEREKERKGKKSKIIII